MHSVAHYFHIYSAAMDSFSMSDKQKQTATKDWWCSACHGVKPAAEVVDIEIQETSLGKAPLSFVFRSGLALARADFLYEFGEAQIREYFWLGKMFLAS